MPELLKLETPRVQLTFERRRPVGTRPVAAAAVPGHLVVTALRRGLPMVKGVWWSDDVRAQLPLAGVIGPRLYEECDYTVFLHSSAGEVRLEHRDPNIAADLRPADGGSTQFGVINFGSQVGFSMFVVLVAGEPEFKFEVEVFPSKLDYRSDYFDIVADIQGVVAGLALEYLRPTYQRGARSSRAVSSDLDWLLALRSVIDQIERSVNFINAGPIRGFRHDEEFVRPHRLRRLDSTARLAVIRGAGRGLSTRHLGTALREWIPSRPSRQTLDTPEHRWLAARIRSIRRKLARIRGSVISDTPRGSRVRDELAAMDARLIRLERSEVVGAATAPPPSGFASIQLMSGLGYRDAYAAITALTRALAISHGLAELPLKDLSTLYEYWCYLTTVDLIARELGQPESVADLLNVDRSGLGLRLIQGRSSAVLFTRARRRITVTYNPQTSSSVTTLVPQRPDILIRIQDQDWPDLLLVLDAKYRVERDTDYVSQYGAPGPPPDALNALHRYRDALLEAAPDVPPRVKRQVVQGVALFPHRDVEGQFATSRLWLSLERLGIGAIPLLPGQTEYLQSWIHSAVTHGGWDLSDHAISHASSDRSHEWKQAAAESVLVVEGPIREESAGAHGAGLTVTIPAKNQPEQLATTWLATATREGRSWRLASYARVIAIRVGRAEITYLTEAPRPSPYPLTWSIEGFPVALPLLTTRLALQRARKVEQLLLKTEVEWRLYEELSALGLEVRLEQTHDGAQSVWIVAPESLRAKASGAGTFTLHQSDGSVTLGSRLEDVLDAVAKYPGAADLS